MSTLFTSAALNSIIHLNSEAAQASRSTCSAKCSFDTIDCDSPQVQPSLFPNGSQSSIIQGDFSKTCRSLIDTACGRQRRLYFNPIPNKIYQLKGKPINTSALALGAAAGGALTESVGFLATSSRLVPQLWNGISWGAKAFFYYQTASLAVEVSQDGQVTPSEAFKIFVIRYFGQSAAETMAKHPGFLGGLLAGLQIATGAFLSERGERFVQKIEQNQEVDFSVFQAEPRELILNTLDAVLSALLWGKAFSARRSGKPAALPAGTNSALVPSSGKALALSEPRGTTTSQTLALYGAFEGGLGQGLELYTSSPENSSSPVNSSSSLDEDEPKKEIYLEGRIHYSQIREGQSSAQNLRVLVTPFQVSLSFEKSPWAVPWRVEAAGENSLTLKPVAVYANSPEQVLFYPDPNQDSVFKVGDLLKIKPNILGAAGQDPAAQELQKLFSEYQGLGFFSSFKKPGLMVKILRFCLKEMGFEPDKMDSFLSLNLSAVGPATKLFDLTYQTHKKEGPEVVMKELREIRQALYYAALIRRDQYRELKIDSAHQPKHLSQNYSLFLLRLALSDNAIQSLYLLKQELPRKHSRTIDEVNISTHLAEFRAQVAKTLEKKYRVNFSSLPQEAKKYVYALVALLSRDSDEDRKAIEGKFTEAAIQFLNTHTEEVKEKIIRYIRAEWERPAPPPIISWQDRVNQHEVLRKYQPHFSAFASHLPPRSMDAFVNGFAQLYEARLSIEAEFNPKILAEIPAGYRKTLIQKMKYKVHPDRIKNNSEEYSRTQEAYSAVIQIAKALEGLGLEKIKGSGNLELPEGKSD